MTKILVTGGAGFIGSHLCDALLARGDIVICVDNFNDYYDPTVKEKNVEHNLEQREFRLWKADILDMKKMREIFEFEKPEKIVHLAARAGVRPSIQEAALYEEVNIKGTLNMLELAQEFGVSNFVFGSSSSVYGKNKKIPFSEKDRVDWPMSPYAATKRAGELLSYVYNQLYGLSVVCLRFFTVYGPRGRPDMMPLKFTQKIDQGEELTVFGTGEDMKRDYTYVGDIVKGIVAALDKEWDFEIINLGNSTPLSLNELIGYLEQILGKKAKVKNCPIPVTEVPITYADKVKAEELLGFKINTDPREGMKKMVAWYKR